MSESTGPGPMMDVEQTSTGVVYAAAEDLPATARQVIEGLQAPVGPDRGIDWSGPGPGAPGVEVQAVWNHQAQEVTYGVRGRLERTVGLDDLEQALAQDWGRYRRYVEVAGRLMNRLEALTASAGLDAEEMEVVFNPTGRTVTADVELVPLPASDGPSTRGMSGRIRVSQWGVDLDLEGAAPARQLSEADARLVLSDAVMRANREPSWVAWEQVRPYVKPFQERGLEVEDPVVRPDGTVSVLVRTQRAALEPMSIYGEQAVAFSLDGDELAIRAGGSTVQQLRSGELEPTTESLPWTQMSDAQVAAALLGMPQEEFDAASQGIENGLRNAETELASTQGTTAFQTKQH